MRCAAVEQKFLVPSMCLLRVAFNIFVTLNRLQSSESIRDGGNELTRCVSEYLRGPTTGSKAGVDTLNILPAVQVSSVNKGVIDFCGPSYNITGRMYFIAGVRVFPYQFEFLGRRRFRRQTRSCFKTRCFIPDICTP